MCNEPDTLALSSPPPRGPEVSLIENDVIENDVGENDVGEAVGMTPMRIVILDFIRDHIERRGYPPSVREIGDAVKLKSSSSVHHHLRRLERIGVLARTSGRCRAIRVVESCAVESGEAA
jgi:repressor LexA